MTKAQLVKLLAERLNLTHTQVALFFETLEEVAQDQLVKNGRFVVPDIVKFTLKDSPARAERTGINPHTKEPMTIAAKPASKRISAAAIGELKRHTATA